MKNSNPESGNIIFFILLGVALIGLVTAAIRSTGMEGANVDKEQLLLNITKVKQYSSELERALVFIMNNNAISEVDLSFAHPNAPSSYGTLGSNEEAEIFHPNGGGAEYRNPPTGVNNGDSWEFYGNTHIPDVGSDEAELIAVLPNVTSDFCTKINADVDLTGQPDDTATCLHGGARFGTASPVFSVAPNTLDAGSFSRTPALQACVTCGSAYHFYHVLKAR